MTDRITDEDAAENRRTVAALERIAARGERIDKLLAENASLLATVQRESADVNRLNGVVAFLSGVIAEIEKANTVEAARTFAIMAREHIDEFIAGKWEPGPGDDAANWKEPSHD